MVTPVLREMKGMVIEMTEQQKKKPNVVFILTDDQGFWSLGCYGNEEIRFLIPTK